MLWAGATWDVNTALQAADMSLQRVGLAACFVWSRMLGIPTANLRAGLDAYVSHSQRLDGDLGAEGLDMYLDDLEVEDCGNVLRRVCNVA